MNKAKNIREYKRSLLMYKLAKDKNTPAMKNLALRLNRMFNEIVKS